MECLLSSSNELPNRSLCIYFCNLRPWIAFSFFFYQFIVKFHLHNFAFIDINNGYVWPWHVLNKVILWVKDQSPAWQTTCASDTANLGDSDKESDYDEDEANIPDEESDYSSPSEDESGEDDADVVEDDTESIEEEGEAARSSKTGCTSQNVRWRKRQPVCYGVLTI